MHVYMYCVLKNLLKLLSLVVGLLVQRLVILNKSVKVVYQQYHIM